MNWKDLRTEVEAHIEERALELIDAGAPEQEAREQARREFGNATLAIESSRAVWRWAWFEQLSQDVRYGIRSLARAPGFTAVAILSLMLGIGANAAVFSIVKRLLIESLPYRDAERLVYVTEFWPKEPVVPGPPAPDFANWRKNSRLVDGIAAYGGGADALNLFGLGEPERVQGTMVTAELLDLLGTKLAIGRNFTTEEDRPGGSAVVILGYSLWQRKFNRSPEVVGQTITLNGTPRTIVGVLPSGFSFPDNNFRHELLVPMAIEPDQRWVDNPNFRLLRVMARLKADATPAALRDEFAALIRVTAGTEPAQMVTMRQGMEVRVIPLRQWLTGPVRNMLLMLESSVALLLMIACLNIASLHLCRMVARERELAVRAAIGASRSRIIRQILTESLLVSVAGAGLGVGLAYASLPGLRAFLPANLHLVDGVAVDATVLGFALGATLLTSLAAGLLPATVASRTRLQLSKYVGRFRLQNALVVSEIAAATVLLIGSALFIRAFDRVASVEPGFNPEGVFTARVSLPPRYADAQSWATFFKQLIERAQEIPGVEATAVGGGLPLVGTRSSGGLAIEGRADAPAGGRPTVPVMGASTQYFEALGIPIMKGRGFTEADGRGPSVVIVNQKFAETYFPGEEAIGKRIEVASRSGIWREIIGIAGNVQQQGRRSIDSLLVYTPLEQTPEPEAVLVLKSNLPTDQLLRLAAAAVHAGDRSLPLYDVATMDERLRTAVSPQRANMILMAMLGGTSFAIAMVGVFALMAFLVTRRLQEMCIRQALGARPSQIVGMVVRHGMILVVTGSIIGLVAARGLGGYIASLLEGTAPSDFFAHFAAVLMFVITGAGACLIPARSAARVDLMAMLRRDQ